MHSFKCDLSPILRHWHQFPDLIRDETHTCYAELRRDTFDRRGRWSGHSWVPCTCRQYVGPRPIDEVFLPRLLPPTGD